SGVVSSGCETRMCGRFTITTDPDKLAKRFGIEIGSEPWRPRYNAAPTQDLPVILNEAPRKFERLRWGLIPSWATDPAIGNRMINARAETLAQKAAFRSALRKRRCLVPADSFYEWKKLPKGKAPMRVTLKDQEPFGMAGLWETWRDPADGVVRSFTIITTEPNELVAPMHDRMPAILLKEDEHIWLDDQVDPAIWLGALRPYPVDRMVAYEV